MEEKRYIDMAAPDTIRGYRMFFDSFGTFSAEQKRQKEEGLVSFIDADLIYREESVEMDIPLRRIDDFIVVNSDEWEECNHATRLHFKFKSPREASLIAVKAAMKEYGPGTKWTDVVNRANDIIGMKHAGTFFENEVPEIPFESATWVKSVDFGRFPETNREFFDFITVEFYLVKSAGGKGFIKQHKAQYLSAIRKNLESRKRFQKFGVPFNFLKLSRIQITKDSAVIFTFDLKTA